MALRYNQTATNPAFEIFVIFVGFVSIMNKTSEPAEQTDIREIGVAHNNRQTPLLVAFYPVDIVNHVKKSLTG
jgi:hypothetical protein